MKWRVCHTDGIKIQSLLRLFSFSYSEQLSLQQKCIPAGCIPPAHWPWGSVPTRGVYMHGRYLPRGCTCPGEHTYRYTPCGQNSWHTLLKILPCPNFVAGGKMCSSEVVLVVSEFFKHLCQSEVFFSETKKLTRARNNRTHCKRDVLYKAQLCSTTTLNWTRQI